MKHSNLSRFAKRVVLLLGLALTGASAASFAHAEDFSPSDFVSLFNGQDFTDWRFGDESAAPKTIPAAWRIEEGVIVGWARRRRFWHRSGDTATSNLNSIGTAATTSMLTLCTCGANARSRSHSYHQSLAVGAQETDRGEGFYNASATGSIGGGGSARKPVPELQKPRVNGTHGGSRRKVQSSCCTAMASLPGVAPIMFRDVATSVSCLQRAAQVAKPAAA